MASYTCPYCKQIMSISPDTRKLYRLNFINQLPWDYSGATLDVNLFRCPECEKISVKAAGMNGFIDNAIVGRYPSASYHKYPDYIPLAIRNDYEEACLIAENSPKAAATLARRCLQGMIRDFYSIQKRTLNEEISALHGIIPEMQWKAIDALRRIGNIGAHMEKDVNLIVEVEPEEAKKLIALIELLIDKWYIARHDEEELLKSIVGIADAKAQARSAV